MIGRRMKSESQLLCLEMRKVESLPRKSMPSRMEAE